jgi:YfaZ precursor
MMKKVGIFMMVGILSWAGACWAEGYEAGLAVGNTSIDAGLHYQRDMANGFWKAGGSALYTDDDNTDYKWVELDFTVGSNALQTGLSCEVGLKGIVGQAEDVGLSGDVGALAFSTQASYLIPARAIPVPLEVFGGISYAPEILSFKDTQSYLAYHLGIGVRIVPNASIILKYVNYDVDMESGRRQWDLDDSVIRLGLVMRF